MFLFSKKVLSVFFILKVKNYFRGVIFLTKLLKWIFPPVKQNTHPGIEKDMYPQPIFDDKDHISTGKLKNKVAIITGGDSGIGRAVSILYAKEGAKVAIVYLKEDADALKTKAEIEKYGGECMLIRSDISVAKNCVKIIKTVVKNWKTINILVNNAAVQHQSKSILKISNFQMERTFKINFFSMFYLTKAALPYLEKGDCIINTGSVVAYKGHKNLIDYSSTKGSVITFTRSMSLSLADKGIRVNCVAPGPIWTPLTASTFSGIKLSLFGKQTPIKRAGEPVELAPAYLFLASKESSYITGETIHVNGGQIVNG